MPLSEDQVDIKHIIAVVTIGVLTRDYDFAISAPDDEIDDKYPIHSKNYMKCCSIIGKLLLKELERKREGKLIRVFYCQLLKSYLRLHSRAINLIDKHFITIFDSVAFFSLHN